MVFFPDPCLTKKKIKQYKKKYYQLTNYKKK